MDNTFATYNLFPIRSTTILTTSYVAGIVIGPTSSGINPFQYSQLEILIQVTLGSLTTVEMKVEFSNDGITWYQETVDSVGSVSSGLVTISQGLSTRQFAASGNYRIGIKVLDQYMRISVKGTGTVTSSSVTINAILGNN